MAQDQQTATVTIFRLLNRQSDLKDHQQEVRVLEEAALEEDLGYILEEMLSSTNTATFSASWNIEEQLMIMVTQEYLSHSTYKDFYIMMRKNETRSLYKELKLGFLIEF